MSIAGGALPIRGKRLSRMGVAIKAGRVDREISLHALKKTARRILAILDCADCELSLSLVGNQEIQKLNARYRHKNEPTDVLSFPLDGPFPAGVQLLGDVVIAVERAKEQARERKKTLSQEMESLLVHGVLHLLGYDHERSKKEARIMRGLERKIARSLVTVAR